MKIDPTTDPNDFAYPSGSLAETYGLGLTKREYFAAMALQGILSRERPISSYQVAAEDAVGFADALIEALNKKSDRS